MGHSTFADVEDEPGARASGNARDWLERACIVVPAFDAEDSIAKVIADLRDAIPELRESIIVVDDGSRDATARIAEETGCFVVTSAGTTPPDGASVSPSNRGKGAALRAGFEAARARGLSVALTVDADGLHPAEEARRFLLAPGSETALVLGVRDLACAGAPRANRFSNGISNFFLSRFARRPLQDTQCGLRRYPIRETLALPTRGEGYDFEAEVLLRAVWNGLEIIETPIRVLYPPDRKTHFQTRRDVKRIIGTVVEALHERWTQSGGRRGEA